MTTQLDMSYSAWGYVYSSISHWNLEQFLVLVSLGVAIGALAITHRDAKTARHISVRSLEAASWQACISIQQEKLASYRAFSRTSTQLL